MVVTVPGASHLDLVSLHRLICVMVGQWASLIQNRDLNYARVGMTLLGGIFACQPDGEVEEQSAAIGDLAVNSNLFAALSAHLQVIVLLSSLPLNLIVMIDLGFLFID